MQRAQQMSTFAAKVYAGRNCERFTRFLQPEIIMISAPQLNCRLRVCLLVLLAIPTGLWAQAVSFKLDPADPAVAQQTQAKLSDVITEADLRAHVGYLASDALEGRLTGSSGIQAAANYLVLCLQKAGFGPADKKWGYQQPFSFTADVQLAPAPAKNTLVYDANKGPGPGVGAGVHQVLHTGADYLPLVFSANGQASADVVFAGYGLVVPAENGQPGYDSYAGLDVKDKIVVVLRYVPENVSNERKLVLNRFADLRYKALLARERGAKGLVVVQGPRSAGGGAAKPVPMTFDNIPADAGILALSLGNPAATEMFLAAGEDLGVLQSRLDTAAEAPMAVSRPLPGLRIEMDINLERIKKSDVNVVAILPPPADAPQEYVLIGAHYDHLGLGEVNSLADATHAHEIHNGADDNASGVATVLELVTELATQPQKFPRNRGIIVAFWSGEELGLIGSTAFVNEPPVDLKNVVAYLNFDMVGRLTDNKLILGGVGSSNYLKSIAVDLNTEQYKFALTLQDDPYQPTDITALYPQGVPVLGFFTGSHADYHKPSDDAHTLNYPGMARIAEFARDVMVQLIMQPERPDYIKVAQSSPGKKGGMRVTVGTLPDYSDDGASGGMRLQGVKPGTPAEKAGFQGGDVLVEFAGQQIKNIYDYVYILSVLQPDKPVKAVVMRAGKKVTLTVTPVAKTE